MRKLVVMSALVAALGAALEATDASTAEIEVKMH
jgi:hypothetical protein